jgi:hypothetical protein
VQQAQGFDVLRLGALTDITRSATRGNLFHLTGLKTFPTDQCRRFESPKVASERRVLAHLENTLAKVVPVWNAKAIHLALPPTV